MSEELSLFDNLESMAPVPTATELDFDFEFTPAEITIVGKELFAEILKIARILTKFNMKKCQRVNIPLNRKMRQRTK
ncbi:TPA: hypothetical protein U1B45_000583 [Streptococcus suis]|nr:hypothetical protein [Streptococcus suis]